MSVSSLTELQQTLGFSIVSKEQPLFKSVTKGAKNIMFGKEYAVLLEWTPTFL